jgi:transposase
MDNYATHKTRPIRNWFAKRPRWHVHFTPTSASWINQVERFFALLTERALKRGVFRSVADLEEAIKAYIDACACRKSNPNILVVQPAQDRAAKNGPGQFDGARDRRILLQR